MSWGEKRHLSVRRDPPGLFLNVRTMWADLDAVMATLATTLSPGGQLPGKWVEKSIHHADQQAAAWREWIATREVGE